MDETIFEKDVPTGRQIVVLPLTNDRGRVSIGTKGSMIFDDEW